MYQRCPKCGGTSALASSEEQRILGEFQAVPPLKCLRCEYLWEPSAPLWLLLLGLAAGVSLLVVGLWLMMGGIRSIGVIVICGGMGSAAVIGCITRLISLYSATRQGGNQNRNR